MTISSPPSSPALQPGPLASIGLGQAFGEVMVKARDTGHSLFSLQLLSKPKFSGVEKIKTIGSTYMAATGLNATSGQDTQQVQQLFPMDPPAGFHWQAYSHIGLISVPLLAHHGAWIHLPGCRTKLQPSGHHGGICSGPGV